MVGDEEVRPHVLQILLHLQVSLQSKLPPEVIVESENYIALLVVVLLIFNNCFFVEEMQTLELVFNECLHFRLVGFSIELGEENVNLLTF